jgi:hypothetical protein
VGTAEYRHAQGPGRYHRQCCRKWVQCAAAVWCGIACAGRAGSAVCGSAWVLCSWQLWCSPAAAKLHNAALPSVVRQSAALGSAWWQPPLRALRVKATQAVMQNCLRWVRSHSRRRSPVAFAPYAPPLAPLWLLWHRGISQALRAVVLVSGLRPVMLCVPRPPWGLAAARLWPCAGLPVRPQGAPSAPRLGCWVLLQVL